MNLCHKIDARIAALSKVAGVYAITDTAHGTTYIGSAYGVSGIWEWWVGYVLTRHNDNALFRSHVEAHGTQHLRFSVLLTMDLQSTMDEVIARESFFKEALGLGSSGEPELTKTR